MKTVSTLLKDNISLYTLQLFIAFTFFSYGTAMMDYFLVYPSRLIVGETEFVTYHELLERRILPISVLPFFIISVLNIILLWFRPAVLPKSLVIVSLVCIILDWFSSVFFQIPMNLQLNEGKNIELINQVMNTNWGRIILETTQALVVFRMVQLITLKK